MMKKIAHCLFLMLAVVHFTTAQQLEKYLIQAAENNPGLLAKYKVFEASLEKVSQAGSLQDPNLSFGYFISPVETRVGPQRARFSLTQMFPWFGTLRAQEDVAALLAEAKYQDFLDAKNLLFSQVEEAYLPLQEIEALIRLEEENRRLLELYKTLATSKVETGQSPLSDALRADILLQASETKLKVLQKQFAAESSSFNVLLARAPNEPVIVESTFFFEDLGTPLPVDSLQNSPRLSSLDLQIQASEASVDLAKKKGMPNIGAGLDYVLVGERTDMSLADNGKNVLMPMVTVSLPIFRGKYKGAQREAELMQSSFALQKENLSNQLHGEYFRLNQEIQIQRELLQLYEGQIETTEQTLDILYTSYATSGKGFEDVLQVQQELLEFGRAQLKAFKIYRSIQIQLDYLTSKSKEL